MNKIKSFTTYQPIKYCFARKNITSVTACCTRFYNKSDKRAITHPFYPSYCTIRYSTFSVVLSLNTYYGGCYPVLWVVRVIPSTLRVNRVNIVNETCFRTRRVGKKSSRGRPKYRWLRTVDLGMVLAWNSNGFWWEFTAKMDAVKCPQSTWKLFCFWATIMTFRNEVGNIKQLDVKVVR